MSSDRLKVENLATIVALRTVVFWSNEVSIDDEAKASTSAGSLAGNRPANREARKRINGSAGTLRETRKRL
jgi:hypothetical protein